MIVLHKYSALWSWLIIDQFARDALGTPPSSWPKACNVLQTLGVTVGTVAQGDLQGQTWAEYEWTTSYVVPSNVWMALKFDDPGVELLFRLKYL